MKIKKQILLTAFLLGIGLNIKAQMVFDEGTWESVKAKAKEAKKPIVVDAYTTWCGPCKTMAAKVFTDKTVGEYYNANYINYKIDMEKEEGLKFGKTNVVPAYPTILYFDANGNPTHRTVGGTTTEQFIANGKDAQNIDKQYFTLKKRYESGERTGELLRNYAQASRLAYDANANLIAQEFVLKSDKKEWTNPDNWAILSTSANSLNSEVFQYLHTNRSKFSQLEKEESYNNFVMQAMIGDLQALNQKGSIDLTIIKDNLKKHLKPEEVGAFSTRLDIIYYSKTDALKAQEAIDTYLTKYSNNWQELNAVASQYYQQYSKDEKNKPLLEKALAWTKKSIDLQENTLNTDTYASLLDVLNQPKEALKWAEKSVILGKANGENTKNTEELIKKLKK